MLVDLLLRGREDLAGCRLRVVLERRHQLPGIGFERGHLRLERGSHALQLVTGDVLVQLDVEVLRDVDVDEPKRPVSALRPAARRHLVLERLAYLRAVGAHRHALVCDNYRTRPRRRRGGDRRRGGCHFCWLTLQRSRVRRCGGCESVDDGVVASAALQLGQHRDSRAGRKLAGSLRRRWLTNGRRPWPFRTTSRIDLVHEPPTPERFRRVDGTETRSSVHLRAVTMKGEQPCPIGQYGRPRPAVPIKSSVYLAAHKLSVRVKHPSLPQRPRPTTNSHADVSVEDRPTVLMAEAVVQRRDVFRQRVDIVDCG